MNWISLADKYPEEKGIYLCHFSDGVIETFDFIPSEKDRDRFWSILPNTRVHVTHWMPLPEPPE